MKWRFLTLHSCPFHSTVENVQLKLNSIEFELIIDFTVLGDLEALLESKQSLVADQDGKGIRCISNQVTTRFLISILVFWNWS